ncbi:hypothetical protein CLCR_10710 [Cladophialophora carrionii]|uniref:Mediator of RNA polymerase II transcription subunit 20 n=1 Tax=Cladophialophora carrionii TaxID=86049 RepID=A0A1C1CYP3_9EURO|nr:hypothetical protein CLCR_10710 [Cladophialophora carrionii]
MPLTGLFVVAVGPGQSSPSAALISHISRSFPAEPLPTFYLDHRLFIDTSSLLPSSNASLRKSTSILTISHTPTTTYVATTSPASPSKEQSAVAPSPTLITIPSTSADSFTQLIGTKLQPLWTHRQSLIIENGTALSFLDGEWIIRIGDLKTPPRANQAGSNLRGMLIEVSHMEDDNHVQMQGPNDVQKDVLDVDKEDEALLRGFLDSVTDGSGVPSITSSDSNRFLIRRTKVREKDKGAVSPAADFELARVYLDILRGSRG